MSDYDYDAAMDQVAEWEEERMMDEYYEQQWAVWQTNTYSSPITAWETNEEDENYSEDPDTSSLSLRSSPTHQVSELRSQPCTTCDGTEVYEDSSSMHNTVQPRLDENSDDQSPRKASLAWAQLLQAPLADLRSEELPMNVDICMIMHQDSYVVLAHDAGETFR